MPPRRTEKLAILLARSLHLAEALNALSACSSLARDAYRMGTSNVERLSVISNNCFGIINMHSEHVASLLLAGWSMQQLEFGRKKFWEEKEKQER